MIILLRILLLVTIITLKLRTKIYPSRLKQISSPPKVLFASGASLNDILERPTLAIIGSRSVSIYGKQVTHDLAYKLASQGVVIVSGLAYGVDGIAHRAALEAGGVTIAVLPSSLHNVMPTGHQQLANQIIDSGGAVVSEYDGSEEIYKTNFVARNRIVAGLSQAVLITEAGEQSGSLHTARFALEQGKDVLAVPGLITTPKATGSNNLLRSGAHVITSYIDVLHVLGINDHVTALKHVKGRNQEEQTILDLLLKGISEGPELLALSKIEISTYNRVLLALELAGKIRSLGNNHWAIS